MTDQQRNSPPRQGGEEDKNFLFVGNPGVGKSTLINGFLGSPKFEAKESLDGTGITFQLDTQRVPGIGTFMDTPGLADEDKKHQAAKAITEALKKDGFYRLFFVLTAEGGRIRPSDKVTMQLILEAAPTISNYSIIVNKVSNAWLTQIAESPENKKTWLTKLMSGLPTVTASIHFMSMDLELFGAANRKYTAPMDVVNFILHAPGMLINSIDVKDVEPDQFAKLEKQHQEMEQKFEKDKAFLMQQVEEQKVQMQEAVERAEAAQKEAADQRWQSEQELLRQKQEMASLIQKADEAQKEAEEKRKQSEDKMGVQFQKAQEEVAAALEKADKAQKDAEEAQRRSELLSQQTAAPQENMFARVFTAIGTLGISELLR